MQLFQRNQQRIQIDFSLMIIRVNDPLFVVLPSFLQKETLFLNLARNCFVVPALLVRLFTRTRTKNELNTRSQKLYFVANLGVTLDFTNVAQRPLLFAHHTCYGKILSKRHRTFVQQCFKHSIVNLYLDIFNRIQQQILALKACTGTTVGFTLHFPQVPSQAY